MGTGRSAQGLQPEASALRTVLHTEQAALVLRLLFRGLEL